MKSTIILLVDAVINLVLGLLLMLFTPGIVKFLGVPAADMKFYPNILGAVLFGIGIALIIEAYRKDKGCIGLGLIGAICINLCGGIILALWLIFGKLNLPLHGFIFLWTLVFILVFLSSLELVVNKKKKD